MAQTHDFGLLVATLALARLGSVYAPNPFNRKKAGIDLRQGPDDADRVRASQPA